MSVCLVLILYLAAAVHTSTVCTRCIYWWSEVVYWYIIGSTGTTGKMPR